MFVVDDEPTVRWCLPSRCADGIARTVEAETGSRNTGGGRWRRRPAAVAGHQPARRLGLDLLREIKRRSPQTAVIMITIETLFENAVAALRGGADDFVIGKPISLEELRFALDHSIKLKRAGSRAGRREPSPHFNRRRPGRRIPHLQIDADSQEVEIASAVFPEEWEYVSGDKHDLAVIDVGPALLEPLLGNLRASKDMRRFLCWLNIAGSRRPL